MCSSTIEETVAELVAERDVRRVLASYCKGIDRCDPALMCAAFWPDAHIDYGSFQTSGAEVGEVIAGKRRLAQVNVMMHSLTTCLVDIEADEAFAEAWYLSLRQVDTAAGVEHRWLGERYLDRLERRDGVWKIAHRRAVHDFDLAQEHRPAFPAGMFLDACASPDDLSYHWRNESFGSEVTS
jgi:SnoaL-like domain